MDHDRWTLMVTFDSIAETQAAGAYEGGMGEAAEFYAHIREWWDSGDPDDLDEMTSLEGETVSATCNSLDPFMEPLKWLFNRTVPQIVTLQRNEQRGRLAHPS